MRSFFAALLLCLMGGTAPVMARTHRSADAPMFDRHAVNGSGFSIQVTALPAMRRSYHRRHAHRRHWKTYIRHSAQNVRRVAKYQDRVPNEATKLSVSGLGNIGGLKSFFVERLAELRAAMPVGMGFSVGSGFRSHAEQARLHRQKPGLAARPGHSNHEKGLAGDLRFATASSRRWVHENARRFSLRFPMGYEPWHIEPVEATRVASRHRHRRYASAR